MSRQRLPYHDLPGSSGRDEGEPILEPGSDVRTWLYFLHGFYGAGRNWRSVARRVVDARPRWGAVLVDLCLHGRSRGSGPPHTVMACASNVRSSARGQVGPPATALLGHSFGGKVALSYLRAPPDDMPVPRQIWVVDSTPSARVPGGSATRMLGVVRSLPESFASRSEAVAGLVEAGFAEPVALWMTTNLERSGERYVWRLDFEALEELLEDFFRTDLWDVVEDPPVGAEIRFIRASDSDILTESDCERVREAGRHRPVHLHVVEGGHWLNADNPEALVRLLVDHLPGR